MGRARRPSPAVSRRASTLRGGASRRFGPARLEVAGPLGLVRWSGSRRSTAVVRVLPDDGTLKMLLPNPEPRAASGMHVDHRRGEGFEFAEIRQYREGDRLRSVNWYQTARRGELWVNEHHPERSGDLVVLVDTFADRRSGGSASLERSVRVAWQIAMAHLGAHDRVGIVGFGGLPSWAAARRRRACSARRDGPAARLGVRAGTRRSGRSRSCPVRSSRAGAQVIAVSGLHDERMTRRHRRPRAQRPRHVSGRDRAAGTADAGVVARRSTSRVGSGGSSCANGVERSNGSAFPWSG